MIDWTRIAELRDEIGAEDFHEVVDLFLKEVETTLADLPGAMAQPAEMEEKLHFLKGSALNLGFSALADCCQSGEIAARSGSTSAIDVDAILSLYARSRGTFLSELPERLAA